MKKLLCVMFTTLLTSNLSLVDAQSLNARQNYKATTIISNNSLLVPVQTISAKQFYRLSRLFGANNAIHISYKVARMGNSKACKKYNDLNHAWDYYCDNIKVYAD